MKYLKIISICILFIIISVSCSKRRFFEAVRDEDFDKINRFVIEGVDVNSTDDIGRTALHYAASSNNIKMAKLLIMNDAKVNVKDDLGITPLFEAVENDSFEMTKVLVENGADVNTKNDIFKASPLHMVFSTELADFLIENGAVIDSVDRNGETPLHYKACEYESIHLMRYFIGKGAKVDCQDHKGDSPLHNAVQCWGGDISMIKLLIKAKADINILNKDKESPLHIAATWSTADIVQLLIANGAEVNGKDECGDTPLHIASLDGKFPIVKLLINKGADVNLRNNNGETPLFSVKCNKNIAQLLLTAGANLVEKDADGKTPLHVSGNCDEKDLTDFFIKKGSPINETDNFGRTPLHYAVTGPAYFLILDEGETIKDYLKYDFGVAEILIEKGADINYQDHEGNTPLHLAVLDNEIIGVRILLNAKAKRDIKNKEGYSPPDIAEKEDYGDIVSLLKSN